MQIRKNSGPFRKQQDEQSINFRIFDRSLPLGKTMISWHRQLLAIHTLIPHRILIALALALILSRPQPLCGQFGYGLLPPSNQQRSTNSAPQQPQPTTNYQQPGNQISFPPGFVPAQRPVNVPSGVPYDQTRMVQNPQPGQAFTQQFLKGQSASQSAGYFPQPNQNGVASINYFPNGPQQNQLPQNIPVQNQLSQYMQQPPAMELYPQNPNPVASWPDQNFQQQNFSQQVTQSPPPQQNQSVQQAPPSNQPQYDQNATPQNAPNQYTPPQPDWVAAPYRPPQTPDGNAGTAAQFTSSNSSAFSSKNVDTLNTPSPSSSPTGGAKITKEDGQEHVFEGGRLLAVVGEEPILLGDLLPLVDAKLAELEGKIPPKQKEIARQQMTRRALQDQIVTKCLAQKFVRDTVGVKPQKDYAEFRKTIMPRTTKVFYTQYVPNLMKRQKVESEQELDEKLREMGTSIAAQHASFADSVLADEVIKSHVPKEPRIDLQAMRDHYDEHVADYQMPAKAKWRQLSVQFANHPSKEAAAKIISDMGNEILFGGTNFEAVAKKMSEGTTASKGGVFDWTTQGALKSTVLDQNIFQLPVNRLSRIIEDETGYHIIEVTERQDARTVSFADAQIEIRKTIQEKRHGELRREFVEKVRKETPVWSLWPQDVPDSRPLSELISDASESADAMK